jgi:hypothetical protein
MFRVHAPAAGRRAGTIVLMVLLAGMLAPRASFAQQPPAQAQPAKNPYVFASDGALLLQFIKADKTADFEMIMAKVKEALNKSDKPERKQQAQSWKLFKAAEAGAGGSAIYVSIIEPAVKGADYTVSTILAEAFPTEANALYKTYAEVFGTPPGNLLNLTLVSDLGK